MEALQMVEHGGDNDRVPKKRGPVSKNNKRAKQSGMQCMHTLTQSLLLLLVLSFPMLSDDRSRGPSPHRHHIFHFLYRSRFLFPSSSVPSSASLAEGCAQYVQPQRL